MKFISIIILCILLSSCSTIQSNPPTYQEQQRQGVAWALAGPVVGLVIIGIWIL